MPVSLMRTFEEKHRVQIRQLWGMTETSPMATMAWPPPGTPDHEYWALRATQGQPVCGVETRIVDDNGTVLPNDGDVGGGVGGSRPVDHRLLLPGTGRVEIPVGVVAYRRCRPDRRPWLHHADRPGQGRDQVRRGMDLVGGVGELSDRTSRRGGGRRRRRPRRALAGAAPGGHRAQRRGSRRQSPNCEITCPTKWFDGGYPSGGLSSTRFR